MDAEQLPSTVFLPNLVLIAQAVFLLECGHGNKHTQTYRSTDAHTKITDTTDQHTHNLARDGMGNNMTMVHLNSTAFRNRI